MDGILNIHKTAGPTSHDVVDAVRRLFGRRKVGHAGTLDPTATGVLIVCVGKATRVVEYLMIGRKQYRARMVLGQATDTQDSVGEIISERDASGVTREAFDEAAAAFVGEIWQTPPMISALKHEGQPLYKLARKGLSVERPARRIDVYGIELLGWFPGERPEAEVLVDSSSGTYIRTLCADIGEKIGCGAHMSMLERTRVGRFTLENSVTIARLEEAKERGGLEAFVTSIDEALSELPAVTVGACDVMNAAHGLKVFAAGLDHEADPVRILSPDGTLIGLGIVSLLDGRTTVKPRKVLMECGGSTPLSLQV